MEKPESLRRTRRRAKLVQLLSEAGGVAQVSMETGTPKSHFSALTNSESGRGVGDALAKKLEEIYGKPAGWFDVDDPTTPHPAAAAEPALADALAVVLKAIEECPERDELRQLLPLLVTGAPAYRQRLAELLGSAGHVRPVTPQGNGTTG